MTDGEPQATTGPRAAGPLVAEDVVRLDLREAPTREEAGLGGGRQDLILSRVGEAIDVELQLPGGTLSLDAFRVNIGGGPAGSPDPSYAERVVVNVRAGDTAALRRQLGEQAVVLGLDPARVQEWADEAGTSSRRDNSLFRSSAVEPAIEVEIRSEDAETWTVNYAFSFDEPPAGAGGTPA